MVVRQAVFRLVASARRVAILWTCHRCCNLPANASPDMVNIEVDEAEDCDSDSDEDLENEVDEIMNDIFGNDTDVEQSGPEADSDTDTAISDTNMDIELDS